ncbi:MAG: translation initiation factor IF-2 subunit beta [Nanoarchaeota archaeon]|nr:MAG: translation initiation factor IF-2 subunit beta [Nanoarchaeota archaeon]
MDYESLLGRGKKQLPEVASKVERFEIPKVLGHIQGNRTIISNFHQIIASLRREPEHFLKFLQKELAVPAEIKKTGLIVGAKMSATRFNEKIIQYTQEFVACPVCKKHDTSLIKEDKYTFIKCQVCGAKSPVKMRI